MATIKLCDWTKARIGKDEETYLVKVGDDQFEVGEAGLKALLGQLEGEEEPNAPQVVAPVAPPVPREPPPPPLQAATPGGVEIEVSDDPFEAAPTSSAPQEPNPAPLNPDDPGMLLEIPDNPKQRLKIPPAALAKKIIAEATKFEEGTLPALTMGNRGQRDAMKKLQALEQREEDKIRRRAGNGVNMNQDLRSKPGYHD